MHIHHICQSAHVSVCLADEDVTKIDVLFLAYSTTGISIFPTMTTQA